MKHELRKVLLCLCLTLPSLVMAKGGEPEVIDANALFESRGYTTPVGKYTTKVSNAYKDFNQLDKVPTYTKGYHPDIDYLDRTVKVVASSGIDKRILKCLLSQHYANTEMRSAKGQLSAKNFINNNHRIWLALLSRYNGDYIKMLEAYKYGATNIDYLIFRYGNNWSNYLEDIDLANASIYVKGEADGYLSFAQEVLSYWED